MAGRDVEQDLVKKIICWLRSQKCVVIETKSPSIFFMKDGFWGAIEVKKTKTSPFQPGQREMVAKLDSMSWAKIVWGGKNSNWPETVDELTEILK